MRKRILPALSVLLSIPVLLFLVLWLTPRPVDHTPAWVFEGDASEIDYCDLPVLDGSGLIPAGNTYLGCVMVAERIARKMKQP